MYGRITVHGIISGLVGYAILHPFSMVIHSNDTSLSGLYEAFLKGFSNEHIIMALYFTILAGVLGVAHGYLTHNVIQLHLQLQSMAITDPLTGVYNRRHLMDFLAKEIDRSERNKSDLSLILIDIDFFKKYNDTFGHVKGDELLVDISTLLKNNVRRTDIVSRYGGEEFAIVLPGAGIDMAVIISNKIRKSIKDSIEFKTEENPNGRLTISVGVTEYNSNLKNIQNFIKDADIALYRAKETGRDKVCSAKKTAYLLIN